MAEGIRKHNLYRSVVYIKYIVNIAILLRSNKKKHENIVQLITFNFVYPPFLSTNVSSFWIVTVLSNHIFVTRSPQRLSSRPLNLRWFSINRFYELMPLYSSCRAFHMHAHPHARTTFKCVFHYALFLYFSRSFPLPTRTRIHSNTPNVDTLYASVRTCRVSWFNNSLR